MNKNESDNNLKSDLILPCVLSRISAGFPSPADDYIENNLSLSELLIKNQLSTFLMKASGDSMTEVGINHNDILLVDRSLEAKNIDAYISKARASYQ